MLDYRLELIDDHPGLTTLIDRIDSAHALALDIETINWWDPQSERVALLQLAFREGRQPQVVIIDALAQLDLEPLRLPFEQRRTTKAIHNAGYDAVRLSRHFRINTSPIHDTMLAARRSGERRCSLQAQAQTHLGLQLDKMEQRSDWSRRPLGEAQLRYAALDAVCTLLLYEDQIGRGLHGDYELRERTQQRQTSLPLSDAPSFTPGPSGSRAPEDVEASAAAGLSAPAQALLGIVTELAGRYSPERLAASVGSERVGLAGWIIDRVLGSETDVDEDTAKIEIAGLCERGLVRLTAMRRLEATEPGTHLWQRVKPV
ncbi:MAG: hypothetical protein H0T92_18530 [Pyrinomonadaceae bacterium]|nr:hypothetical protein [Pyrinomonadaceae bacterium]